MTNNIINNGSSATTSSATFPTSNVNANIAPTSGNLSTSSRRASLHATNTYNVNTAGSTTTINFNTNGSMFELHYQ